ncbi:uncharacterized protein LOC142349717 isoform X2 [Convolutriloba macropyga]|uniref:uncharacterized protein LOC142349717 isoform X2 n=1 Tax=Convolutriloba macropyga TaxID=536237 RepID=UPI003F527586
MDAFYVALYPYSYAPSADSHVSFEAGDVFVLKDNSNSEWWLVSPIGSDDSEFYVPANYIEQMGTTPQDEENHSDEAVTPQADFLNNRIFVDLSLGVQQEDVSKSSAVESRNEESYSQVRVEVKQQQHNQTPDEHQSTDSGAIDGGLGSCDSLSTDSELSPNKVKHVDSGADSIDSMSNLPSDSIRNSLLPSACEQPVAANRRLLHSPIFANIAVPPQSEEITRSNLVSMTEDQSNAPSASVRTTRPIVRPSTHMEPDTRNSIADLLNESNDSDDAPRAKPRTFSLAQEVSTRKDSRSQSIASIGRQSTLEKYPKKSSKAPLQPPTSYKQQPQTKKKSLKEKLSGTISSHHSKARSEIEPMAGGDLGVERSSFRKSLDDLITQEDFHFKDNQLSNGTGVGSVSHSVMSSTFSIATTTAAAGGAPSMDCLCLTEDEGDQYSSDDLLRSESMGCFLDESSAKTPFAFFEKVHKRELSDYTDTHSSHVDGKSSNPKDVLREGVLYKKVETENSKSLLSWPGLKQQGKCFVQLTERALLFFKDKKHAQQSGCGVGGVAQSRPEHSFELFASNIEWRRGKKNTFQLWCDFMPANKVLLKSANPYDAAQWYDSINRTILNLKTGVTKMDTDFDQASLLTTAASIGDGLTSIGGGGTAGMFGSNSTLNRNNHYKKNSATSNFYAGPDKISYRKEKSNDSSVSLGSLGSQTTLSSTSGVRNCLAQLLKSRPSVDALRKKGILKSAPVFGCVLEVRSQTEKRLVPEFVVNGMREVERRGLDIEGIYRLCGNMAEIQKLRFEVDKNSGYNLSQVNDIHVITGALKMYFRELPESLFPSSSYQTLADTFNSGKDMDEMADIVRSIVSTFSRTHQAVILHLFTHLLLVVENQQLNKMDSTNVAIVFGPNLIFPPDHISMAASVATTNSIMQLTLSHLATIFPPQVADGLLEVAHTASSHNSLRHSYTPSPTSELYRQLVLKGNNNPNTTNNSNASSRVSSLHLLGSLERGGNSPWDESPTSGFDPVI